MLVQLFAHSLVPSNPNITECPAGNMYKDMEIMGDDIALWEYEDIKRHRDRDVAGVLGPLACNLCPQKCNDAYAVVYPDAIDGLKAAEIPLAETPVRIRMLEEATKEYFGYDQPANTTAEQESTTGQEPAWYGWNATQQNALLNLLIDVVNAGVVSVGPDGDLKLSKAP